MKLNLTQKISVCMLLLLFAGSAVAEVKSLPAEIPQFDPKNYYACPVEGLYEAEVSMNESIKREFNLYYPQNFEPNGSVIYFTLPAGAEVEKFLETSGWQKLSEEEKILLVLMKPEKDAWQNLSAEIPYFEAVYGFVSSKPYIPIRKHNVYIAAYDAKGLGTSYAINRPGNFAGIFDASAIGLNAGEAESLNSSVSAYFDKENNPVALNKIIFPVWLAAENDNEDFSREVEYFKNADRTVSEAVKCELADNTVYYAPDSQKFDRIKYPEFEPVAGVFVTKAGINDVTSYEFSRTVWANMFKVLRRYPDFGEIRSYLAIDAQGSGYKRYDALVYGGDYLDGHTTKPGREYSRFWYTYIPANIGELENVPVVFVLHGSGGGPNEIAEQTGWRLFAEEHGIILVIPMGSANWAKTMSRKNGVEFFTVGNQWRTQASAEAPNDLLFFDYLYDWLTKDFEYAGKVDISKIYASGQSMGGECSYSLIKYRPQYFAAIAPCSFIVTKFDDANEKFDVPVINTIGQKDTTIQGGFSENARFGSAETVFDYFTKRYNLSEKGGKNRTWKDFTWLASDSVCTEKSGSLNLYIFQTKKGFPMFTAAEGQGHNHATTIEEVNYIWGIFEHYARDPETRVLYYDGEIVDTPANLKLSRPAAKKLPRAEDIKVDLNNYYGQKIEGYYNFDCVVSKGADKKLGGGDDVIRTAKFYIPAGTVFNQPTVFVGVPDDVDTWDFLIASGWKTLADELKLHIVLMEPENGKWGYISSEIDYINALNEDVSFRPFFCAFSSNFYGIAYGEAADILLHHSINKPKSWAGIAILGTSGLTAEEVSDLQKAPSKVPGITLADVQTPIWASAPEKNAEISRLIDFYKHANHSQPEPTNANYAQEIYLPQNGGTVDDKWCANVVFDAGVWQKFVNADYSRKIYKELFEGVYRYPGDSNGALRRPGEIFSRGFEKFEAKVPGGYAEDGSDLYNREWYVYYPESARVKVEAGEKIPLVFVFHGAGGSGNEISDRSGWAEVAEKRGFIIVAPTGSVSPSVRHVSDITTTEYFRAMWYPIPADEGRPDDTLFVKFLHGWMLEHFPVDSSRVYASGQSSGGFMSWTVASVFPELFAAVAPISANTSRNGDSPLPIKDGPYVSIICFMGEEDTTIKDGFAADQARENIEAWIKRDKLVESYDTYTYMADDSRAPKPEGNFTRYAFHNADGVPLMLLNEVAAKTHAILPSECFYAWDNWFVNYSKEGGSLYYKGQAVK